VPLHIGSFATEEAAAKAYDDYVEDGILPDRAPASSQIRGVSWDKKHGTWRADCMGQKLGCHATEEGAARAYTKYANVGRCRLTLPKLELKVCLLSALNTNM
jgi:hypothetical protein